MTQTAEAETIQRLRLRITADGAKDQKEAKVGSAPGTQSPSPAALAASYTQVRGDISLFPPFSSLLPLHPLNSDCCPDKTSLT